MHTFVFPTTRHQHVEIVSLSYLWILFSKIFALCISKFIKLNIQRDNKLAQGTTNLQEKKHISNKILTSAKNVRPRFHYSSVADLA